VHEAQWPLSLKYSFVLSKAFKQLVHLPSLKLAIQLEQNVAYLVLGVNFALHPKHVDNPLASLVQDLHRVLPTVVAFLHFGQILMSLLSLVAEVWI
jgi:hypothetical protein